MHHHDVPLANKGHPAIGWQAHRIQLDQIRIERQIAIDHRIKPDGVSHHRQGAPDLAIDHHIGVKPGFTLVARCRHQAAKAYRYHPSLIVHLAGYILAGDGAIAVGGHLEPAPVCGVAAQVEAGWRNGCPGVLNVTSSTVWATRLVTSELRAGTGAAPGFQTVTVALPVA